MSGLGIFFRSKFGEIDYEKSRSELKKPPKSQSNLPHKLRGGYKDYKEHYNDLLQEYLEHRVVLELEESSQDAMQMILREIPHVDEALHDARLVTDMDMYTKNASFELLSVTKVWKQRGTRRFAVKQAYPDAERSIFEDEGTLSRIRIGYTVYDGPLGTTYRDVLNVEVTQCFVNLSQVRQSHITPKIKDMRMPIFFYNQYASIISDCLRRVKYPAQLYISLENVPAKCIFPSNDYDWYDTETLTPYYIAIGDDSSINISNSDDNDVPEKLRFDSKHLRIHIGWKEFNDAWTEYRIRYDGKKILCENTTTLHDSYKIWSREEQERNKVQPETPTHHKDHLRGQVELTIESQRPESPKQQQPTIENDENTTPPSQDSQQETQSTQGSSKKARRELSQVLREAPANEVKFAQPRDGTIKDETIHYHKLSELQTVYDSSHTIEYASVYGVVIGFGAPQQTKIGSWMINVTLVDESLPIETVEGNISVRRIKTISSNIFCKKKEELPQLKYAGDVLRIHRGTIETYKGELQLCGKQKASYLVFRGDNENLASNHWTVVPTAKREYKFNDYDKARCVALWQWGALRLFKFPTMRDEDKIYISDLKRQGEEDEPNTTPRGVDMTVMVGAIIPVPEDQRSNITPRGYLRVWDGTGPPISDPLPVTSNQAILALQNGDPPNAAVEKIAKLIAHLKDVSRDPSVALELDIDAPFSLTGRVVNVCVWEDQHWNTVEELVKVGTFLRLRNVVDQKVDTCGLRCIVAKSKAHITPLPRLTHEVALLLRDHGDRIRRKELLNPQSGILPVQKDELQAMGIEPESDEQIQMELDVPIVSSQRALSRFSQFKDASIGTAFDESICHATEDGTVYRFGVYAEDETGEVLPFVVNESGNIGTELFGISAEAAMKDSSAALFNLSQVLESRKIFQVKARIVEFNDRKWFFMDEIVST